MPAGVIDPEVHASIVWAKLEALAQGALYGMCARRGMGSLRFLQLAFAAVG